MKFSKSIYSAFLAAGLLWLPSNALAAGFQNAGQSATAVSLGFQGVANPDEPNSSFYNAANMGFSEGLKVYVGDTILLPTSTFKPTSGDAKVETVDQIFPPPNAHISYNNIADSGVSAGVGLTFPYGLGIEWPADWVGRTVIVKQDLQTINLNPNVAYKIPGVDLSVAAGAQVVFGTLEMERSIDIGADDFVEAHLGGSGMGFGGTASVMYRPLEELTIGAQYRSRVKVNVDDGNAHFSGAENTPFFNVFRDNPGSTDITLPDTVNFGVGYQLDKLFLTAQVDLTMWSTYDKLVLDIDTGGDPDALDKVVLENNWEEAMAFRLGAQYEVTEALSARFGAAYDMTPIPDETVSASLPDNDRVMGSLGLGYTYADFRVDAAYSLVHAMSRDIQNGQTPSGTYGTDAHIFALNLGYGF